jgi:hypothetical protein
MTIERADSDDLWVSDRRWKRVTHGGFTVKAPLRRYETDSHHVPVRDPAGVHPAVRRVRQGQVVPVLAEHRRSHRPHAAEQRLVLAQFSAEAVHRLQPTVSAIREAKASKRRRASWAGARP